MVRENGSWTVRRPSAKGAAKTFLSKAKALAAAKTVARNMQPSQVVVEDGRGRIREHRVYGLPKLQPLPYKSTIDRAQIERAVLKVADLTGV